MKEFRKEIDILTRGALTLRNKNVTTEGIQQASVCISTADIHTYGKNSEEVAKQTRDSWRNRLRCFFEANGHRRIPVPTP